MIGNSEVWINQVSTRPVARYMTGCRKDLKRRRIMPRRKTVTLASIATLLLALTVLLAGIASKSSRSKADSIWVRQDFGEGQTKTFVPLVQLSGRSGTSLARGVRHFYFTYYTLTGHIFLRLPHSG